jgi:hypothetical protein
MCNKLCNWVYINNESHKKFTKHMHIIWNLDWWLWLFKWMKNHLQNKKIVSTKK